MANTNSPIRKEMRIVKLRDHVKELLNWLWTRLLDKCGDLPLGKDASKRSEIKIGKTLYIITSRYSGKENIMDKFKRLILRKLERQSKDN